MFEIRGFCARAIFRILFVHSQQIVVKMATSLPFIVASTQEGDECYRCRKKIKNGAEIKHIGRKPTLSKSGHLKMGAMSQVSALMIHSFPIVITAVFLVHFWAWFVSQQLKMRKNQLGTTSSASSQPLVSLMNQRSKTLPHFATKTKHLFADTVSQLFSHFQRINHLFEGKCFRLSFCLDVIPVNPFAVKRPHDTEADENNNEPKAKRLKLEQNGDNNDVNEVKIKSQNKNFFSLRNKLQSQLNDSDYVAILEENKQFIPNQPKEVCEMLQF